MRAYSSLSSSYLTFAVVVAAAAANNRVSCGAVINVNLIDGSAQDCCRESWRNDK